MVRVDWREVGGKLYFGELTFTPAAGLVPFTPESWDEYLGSLWDLPRRGRFRPLAETRREPL